MCCPVSEAQIELALWSEQAEDDMIERGVEQFLVVGVTCCHRSEPLPHVRTTGLSGH